MCQPSIHRVEPAFHLPICTPGPGETSDTDVKAFFCKTDVGSVRIRTCFHQQPPVIVLEVCSVAQGSHSLKATLYKTKCFCLNNHQQSLFRVYLFSLFASLPTSPPPPRICVNNELFRSFKGTSLTPLGKASNVISS